ncbi:MAG: translation initiation factor IF-2, partial [Planctomycetota bacterium]
MARRVFEVAKELGVASKAVVAKCHAEGIPESLIKNHMSTVSAGLEATIRQWFSEAEAAQDAGGTAVETAAKVDITKVRAKPRRKAVAKKAVAKKATPVTTDDAPATTETTTETTTDTATDTAVAATTEAPAAPTTNGDAAPADAPAATPAATPAAKATAKPAAKAVSPAASSPPTTPPPATGRPTPVIAGLGDPSKATGVGTQDTSKAAGNDSDGAAATPAARKPGDDATGTPAATPAPKPTPRPAPPPRPTAVRMNVPDRPDVVAPAGRKIDDVEKKTAKLSGPKVVRVEAPERIDPPRPRAPRGPGGGFGAPGGMPGDGGRSPRRGGGGARRGPGGRDEGGAGAGFSQQDLAEREAKLLRSGGYLRQRRQQAKRAGMAATTQTPVQTGGTVKIAEPFTIKDLSAATGVKAAEIVKKLFMQGVMATANSGIDAEKAQEIMFEYNIELEVEESKSAEQKVTEEFGQRDAVDERRRGPVVTILGHVDHGKTSLLDRIRNANVADGEAGGITQATSAFRVPVKVSDDEKQVVFIDTPGHEAFTEMRSRGANVTDLCVIVVAADDGVMPQTIESISHAKAAGTPIVVALNKIDKPEATDSNIQKILGQLAEHELNPVDWGGDTEVIRTSATKGEGIQELLEVLDYQAELLELNGDFGGPARGTVIEARQVEGRGTVANILVSDGELKVGDFIVAGRGFGRVRDITDDRGKKLKSATPPMPVQISGLDELPDAGDHFYIVDSLKKANEAAQQRRDRDRQEQLAQPKVTLDSMLSQMQETDIKEILIVLKADVRGSVDVLRNEIEKVSTDEVKVRVLQSAVGGITES